MLGATEREKERRLMNADEQTNGAMTVAAGTSMTDGFSGMEVSRRGELATTERSAAAVAREQARFIVAQRCPRDLDLVRLAMLKRCRQPAFAAIARYRKPIGDGIEGPSIRFAEMAGQAMGNIATKEDVISEDAERRVVSVSVTDLESNLSYESNVVVEKTVERSKLKDGQVPIRMRTNSVGKATYLVAATEDEIQAKQGALRSKALRDHILRILPGDLKDECMDLVIETLAKEDAADPTLARKKMVDAFDRFGVKPSDLRDYIGRDLDGITPAEMSELRAVAATIRDGEATWKETLDNKLRTRAANVPEGEKPATVKDKAKAKAEGTKAPPKVVEEQKSLIDVSDAAEPPFG